MQLVVSPSLRFDGLRHTKKTSALSWGEVEKRKRRSPTRTHPCFEPARLNIAASSNVRWSNILTARRLPRGTERRTASKCTIDVASLATPDVRTPRLASAIATLRVFVSWQISTLRGTTKPRNDQNFSSPATYIITQSVPRVFRRSKSEFLAAHENHLSAGVVQSVLSLEQILEQKKKKSRFEAPLYQRKFTSWSSTYISLEQFGAVPY